MVNTQGLFHTLKFSLGVWYYIYGVVMLPFALPFTALFFYIAIFRHQLFNIIPLVYKRVFEWTDSGIVVTEIGGPVQHRGIIAREYGILCVSGLMGIMDVIKDGDLLEVDGSNGIVKILEG